MGRKSEGKVYNFKLRMTREDFDKLNFIVKNSGITKSDVMRDALDIRYKMEQFKK